MALLKAAGGRGQKLELFVSVDIMKEFARVLSLPKFLWPESRTKKALAYINDHAKMTDPIKRIEIITDDDTDNRILECADAASADYIVSGDRRLLALNEFEEIKVLNPANLLHLLAEA